MTGSAEPPVFYNSVYQGLFRHEIQAMRISSFCLRSRQSGRTQLNSSKNSGP